MDDFRWMNDNEQEKNSSAYGCNFLFLLFVILSLFLGLIGIKTGDILFNDPKEQIVSQLPNFIDVPEYDPKDNSPKINEVKGSSENERWYEIKIYSTHQKEYLYLAKVTLKKRFFLNPKVDVIEVLER